MTFAAQLASTADLLPLRERYRREMACQIVHDSIHRRAGWTRSWLLHADGAPVGFGSVAEAGPWKDKPTLFEFDVLPNHRTHAFRLFETLLDASRANFIETQSNSVLLASMLHAYSPAVSSEKILFADAVTTTLEDHGTTLRRVSSSAEDRKHFDARDGSTEWKLDLGDDEIGRGGIAFHYNAPYGDVYMEVNEPYRRRGYGSFFVQELKRICRELGGIPAARCSPENTASRQTCQKAGMVPVGHLLVGAIQR